MRNAYTDIWYACALSYLLSIWYYSTEIDNDQIRTQTSTLTSKLSIEVCESEYQLYSLYYSYTHYLSDIRISRQRKKLNKYNNK